MKPNVRLAIIAFILVVILAAINGEMERQDVATEKYHEFGITQ